MGLKPPASAKPRTGIYIPDTFGQFWRPKLAQAGTGKAVIAFTGDSVTRGYYTSTLTKGWAPLVAAALKTQYGDGGSGYQSMADTANYMVARGLTAPQAAFYDTAGTAEFIATTGTWVDDGGGAGNSVLVLDGPAAAYLKSTTVGSTLTAKVRGTTIKVWGLSTAQTGQQITVAVDGGAPATYNIPVGNGIWTYTAPTVAAGLHTVVVNISAVGGAGQYTYIHGFYGENAAGVVANNFGVGSQRSAALSGYSGSAVGQGVTAAAASGTFGKASDWTAGPSYPADLLVTAFGLNDLAAGSISADTWAKNVHFHLDIVKGAIGGAAGNTDIVLLIPHWGKFDSSKLGAEYALRARGLAEHYGAMLVNFNAIGRNSYDYWSALGYWSGGPGNPGVAGADNGHPSDAGHQFMANTLLPLIT